MWTRLSRFWWKAPAVLEHVWTCLNSISGRGQVFAFIFCAVNSWTHLAKDGRDHLSMVNKHDDHHGRKRLSKFVEYNVIQHDIAWLHMITTSDSTDMHRFHILNDIEVLFLLRSMDSPFQSASDGSQPRHRLFDSSRKHVGGKVNNQGSLNREKYDDPQIHAFDIGWSWLNPPKQNCSLHALRRSEELRVEILGTNLLPQVQVNAQSLPKSDWSYV